MEEKRTLLLEGLLPVDVWNTLIVILILFGVFIAVFKGIILIRDEMEKRKKKKQLNNTDITDQINTDQTKQLNAAVRIVVTEPVEILLVDR